jgi:hypothetical protein
MSKPASIPDILDLLARDPLRHISLLKHILAYPEHARVHHLRGAKGTATLVALDATAIAYDRETYPRASVVVFIASDDVDLTAELLQALPRGAGVVFKLCREEDLVPLAAQFNVQRRTAFVSFTSATPFARAPGVAITSAPSDAAYAMFEAQGHDRSWLEPLLRGGKAFACVLEPSEAPPSACFVFENFGAVWEVGGVVTAPSERRKGHSARVVGTALAEIARRGFVPRYNVEESNAASIGVARALGLAPFLTVTHYAHGC